MIDIERMVAVAEKAAEMANENGFSVSINAHGEKATYDSLSNRVFGSFFLGEEGAIVCTETFTDNDGSMENAMEVVLEKREKFFREKAEKATEVEKLRAHIAELEAENAKLRDGKAA